MVWSQYVYEANSGFEVRDGDETGDEETQENVLLNIEDWEIEYSDELRFMWGVIRTLLYDAHIECKGEFSDFVWFCYTDHDEMEAGALESAAEDQVLSHIWKHMRRIVSQNGLHTEMMRGANFNNFSFFMKNYVCV